MIFKVPYSSPLLPLTEVQRGLQEPQPISFQPGAVQQHDGVKGGASMGPAVCPMNIRERGISGLGALVPCVQHQCFGALFPGVS